MFKKVEYKLDVESLLDNKINIEDSLGKLCLTEEGDFSLYFEDNEISEPTDSVISEESVKSDSYEILQSPEVLDKLFHKANFHLCLAEMERNNETLEDVKIDLEKINKIIGHMSTKYDLIDVKFINQSIFDLTERIENIKECKCDCSSKSESNEEEIDEDPLEFEWENKPEISDNVFVKLNSNGKLEKADFNSNMIGITKTNNLKSGLYFSGLVSVRDNNKCIVGKKCSVKNSIAVMGNHFNVIRRLDEDKILILLK